MPDPIDPIVRLNVEVPDSLRRRLKQRALDERTDLRAVVLAALTRYLATRLKKGGRR